MTNLLLLIPLLFAAVSPLHAHDPGLSRAGLQSHAEGMTVHMVFARKDIDALLQLDTDLDGRVSGDEISTARTRLQSTLAAGIELRCSGKLLRPKSVQLEAGSSDSLNVVLSYDRPTAAVMQLSVPLIAQLARGHRQYLTIRDVHNKLSAQYILDATTAQITL